MFSQPDYIMTIGAMVFILLDIVTGFFKSIATKTLSSSAMRSGLIHKVGTISLIAVAYVLQWLSVYGLSQYMPVDFVAPAVPVVCGAAILMELLSIVENVGEINPELKNTSLLKLFASVESSKDGE